MALRTDKDIDATLPAQADRPAASSAAAEVDGVGATASGAVDADHTIDATAESLAGVPPVVVRAGGRADFAGLRPIDPQHFSIVNEMARGGMGRILVARDRRLGRPVAIKELLSNATEVRSRFEREARITAQLQHPSIVSIHEAGEWPNGDPFYVMELVAGQSLDKVIASQATLERRLALLPNVIAAVDALAYAHTRNVIHRDLKPANVLVGEFGETVVIDWGLAKDLSIQAEDGDVAIGPYRNTQASGGETMAGSVMGTPAYMPVEQARGMPVDARADVYSLGAMLYHVLVGAPPFAGATVDETLELVIRGAPTSILSRVTGVPADLATIVEKAMSRRAEDRYPTAREMADDLKRFQTGQLVGAHRYSTWQLITRWIGRHRIALGVAAGAGVLLLTLGVVSLRRIVAEQRATERQSALTRQTRGEAEGLMSFMLNDLRDKLQPLGKVKLLEDVANKAVAYYANRTDSLSDADQAHRAEARRNLGDVLRAQGDLDRALHEFSSSLATVEVLAARQPLNLELQHDLAITHYKLGGVLVAKGDSTGALAAFTRQREIAETLVAKVPTNGTWLRTLALGHTNIGRMRAARGDGAGALVALREALAMRTRLAAIDPVNGDWQHDLAMAHVMVGETLQVAGDAEGTLVEFRAAQAIASALAARDTTNALWQGDLAVTHQKLGEVLVARGDSAGALAAFRACLAVYTALAAKDPDNAYAQSDVSGVEVQLGDLLLATGDATSATESFRATLAISETLAAKDPSNADRKWAVAFSHEKLGDGLLALGNNTAALVEFQSSLAIAEVIASDDPGRADKQQAVAAAREKIGDVLFEAGDRPHALAQYKASFAIVEKLAADDPAHADKQRALAIAHVKLGDIALANDPQAAVTRFRRAAAILEKLANSDPTSLSRASDVALTRAKLGGGLIAQGDIAGAVAEYHSFLATAGALATKDPDNRDWQALVVEAHSKLGDALLANHDIPAALVEYATGLDFARRLQAIDAKYAKDVTALQTKLARARARQ